MCMVLLKQYKQQLYKKNKVSSTKLPFDVGKSLYFFNRIIIDETNIQ